MKPKEFRNYAESVQKFPDIGRTDFILTRSKIQLLISYEELALATLRCNFVATDQVPTMTTDGTTVYFNPEKIESLAESEISRLLLHVCLHPHLFHMDRQGARELSKWLRACDIECALEIDKYRQNLGYYQGRERYIRNEDSEVQALMKRFTGQTAEQIYDALADEPVSCGDTHDWVPANFPKDRITAHRRFSQNLEDILEGVDTSAPADVDEQYALVMGLSKYIIKNEKEITKNELANFIKWTQNSGIRKELAVLVMKDVVRYENPRNKILSVHEWLEWSREYKFYIL